MKSVEVVFCVQPTRPLYDMEALPSESFPLFVMQDIYRQIIVLITTLQDTVVLAISKDLPFAHGRFCTTEGIENVIPLSDFRFSDFDESYGVRMADGPLAGLLARAVVVIGKDGKIAYTELVPEITQEPDYDKALAAVK